MIEDFLIDESGQCVGCYKRISLLNEEGSVVNFIVSPTTYFVERFTAKVGDDVTGYYDGNAPVPLIYPPQYRALVMVKNTPYYNVKVDHFLTIFECMALLLILTYYHY